MQVLEQQPHCHTACNAKLRFRSSALLRASMSPHAVTPSNASRYRPRMDREQLASAQLLPC
jgi:hypothetical protein